MVVEPQHYRLCLLLLPCLLAACQSLPETRVGKPEPPASGPVPAAEGAALPASSAPGALALALIPEAALTAPAAVDEAPAPELARPAPPVPDPDLWTGMRAGFALPGCDYSAGVERWARRYAASPHRFAAVLDDLLPALDYVYRQVDRHDLPAEFALLPIVESHYRPYPGSEQQPAGIWQMIAPTGRSAGLRVDSWFDGRLNLAASTEAAMVLLDRYGDRFNLDWRLVAFAYNSGEYRVKQALRRHRPGTDFASLRRLDLAQTTYEYLEKLLALACLVREPDRFDLELPSLAAHRRLQQVPLQGAVGESLARALSGLDEDEHTRFNGGLRRGRTPPGDAFTLLVAADRAEAVPELLATVPAVQRLHWRRRLAPADDSLDAIARRHGMPTATLLAVNGLGDGVPSGGRHPLWLPGEAPAQSAPTVAATDGYHVVRRGESLWSIGRRHGLTVPELLRYNRLNHSGLRPGQRLRLSAP